MKLKIIQVLLVLISILILGGCSQQKAPDCNSVYSPTVNVVCKHLEVGGPFCYAYPSGEQSVTYKITYMIVSYDNQGQELGGGDIGAGGSVEVKKGAAYVEAWPNLNGKFCKNKAIRVTKDRFIGLNNAW